MPSEELAIGPMAGGILQNGYQCGMIWGSVLAAGRQAYVRLGATPEAEALAVKAAGRLVDSFRNRYKFINCVEITQLDKSSSALQMLTFFLLKGGAIGCFRKSAQFAKVALGEIEAAMAEPSNGTAPQPASCAAELARKMGASEMHCVMAAGLAGGIGLSGGACGALGAAIWIVGLQKSQSEKADFDLKQPHLTRVVDRFLKASEYRFECSEIVGRKFEDLNDHSGYLRGGGCAALLETLSTD